MALSDDKEDPDEHVRRNALSHAFSAHGNGAVPKQGRQAPCIRASDCGKMDGGGQARVLPIEGALAEQVYNVDDLCSPEERAHPEHNEGEHE